MESDIIYSVMYKIGTDDGVMISHFYGLIPIVTYILLIPLRSSPFHHNSAPPPPTLETPEHQSSHMVDNYLL